MLSFVVQTWLQHLKRWFSLPTMTKLNIKAQKPLSFTNCPSGCHSTFCVYKLNAHFSAYNWKNDNLLDQCIIELEFTTI